MSFDYEFVWSRMPFLLNGALMTFYVSVIGLLIITPLGLLGAIARRSRNKILSSIVAAYVEVARNTPEVLQIFFIYFALPQIGITIPVFWCGIIAVCFFGTAYFLEVFRSGIDAVHKNQVEAAKSLALKDSQVMFYVVLPQALKICLPAAIGYFIFILKMTSILHAISIPELTFVATVTIATYFRPFEMFTAIAVLYLIIVWFFSWLGSIVEKKMSYEF